MLLSLPLVRGSDAIVKEGAQYSPLMIGEAVLAAERAL